MIKAFLFFVISILLYIFSPNIYSYNYNLIVFTFFCISSLWFLYATFDGNYFNFHVLFLISYFFVSFVYPVFLFPNNPEYFPVYKRSFDYNIITRATSLSLLGITSYFLGAVLTKSKTPNNNFNYKILSPKSVIQTLIIISFVLFMVVLYNSWDGIVSGQFGATDGGQQYLLALFQISFEIALIIEIYNLNKQYEGSLKLIIFNFNKQLLALGIIFSFLFIRVGDRGPVIQLFLILLALYATYIKRLSLKMFLVLIIAGMLSLTFIAYARTQHNVSIEKNTTISSFLENGSDKIKLNSFWDIGMDLIVNNRNLYVGMKYADENGLCFGKNMFSYLFAPIPIMPTFMSKLVFNSTPTELSSGHIITTKSKANYGLGTHLIADIYMSFGAFGVVFFMLFFGYFIRNIQLQSEAKNNIVYLFLYFIMISFSIYMPRAPYFTPLRFLFWTVLLYYFVQLIVQSIILYQNRKKITN